jgi:predicted RND superfamily exporter protein
MMEIMARFLVRREVARVVVAAVTILAAVSLQLALQVDHDDDLLAFLPQGNAEVETFLSVNKGFGGLDLALVGLETDDVFDPAFLATLRKATRRLEELEGLAHVMSLANVEDFSPDASGGIVTGRLVHALPTSLEERDRLAARVLSRDQVVGNLVSADGKAALVYCALADGQDPRTMAGRIREVVRAEFPATRIVEGGNPFISASIYDTTQRDMARLTPWSVAVIVLILIVAFRNLMGSVLALISTGIGILVAVGSMSAAGESFNIVLGSMPVILFAVGSAYSIHVLARFYALSAGLEPAEAVVRTLVSVGPTVIAAGLTTIAGFTSFLLMDIEPLQTFGLYTAIGIFVTLVLALTFVPAVIVLLDLRPRADATESSGVIWGRLARWAQARRVFVGTALVAVAACGALLVGQVDSRMDPRSFYSEGSPPDLADRFMAERFGGSQFIQLHVRGDLEDPEALREIRWLADEIRGHDRVSSVTHIGQVIALVNRAFEGQERIPDTSAKVRAIYGMLAGQPSVGQLMTEDRRQALVHVKVNATGPEETEPVLARIEALVADWRSSGLSAAVLDGPRAGEVRARITEQVASRVAALAAVHGVPSSDTFPGDLAMRLSALEADASPSKVAARLAAHLRSDESLVDLEPDEAHEGRAARVGGAVAALGRAPSEDQLMRAIAQSLGTQASAELVDDTAFTLATPLREIWTEERAAAQASVLEKEWALKIPDSGHGERFRTGVATALTDLGRSSAWVRVGDSSPLAIEVTGLPVLHRGLSRSVRKNQISSLTFALGVVLILMTLLFRSPLAGIIGSMPTAVTLLVIYGGMGWLGIRLDIGTSMLASLIIGAGVDYGVHLMSAWRAPLGGSLGDAAEAAGRETGPAIWTNALTVSAGFFVLTLGDARPLKNVGGLTASAMICAALITFLAVPAFARRLFYVPERRLSAGPVTAPSPVDA